MTVLAAAQDHTLWVIALALGIVVVLVVIVLMRRLLTFLKAYEARATQLVELGSQVAASAAPVEQIAATGTAASSAAEPSAQTQATVAAAAPRTAAKPPPSLTALLRELWHRRKS